MKQTQFEPLRFETPKIEQTRFEINKAIKFALNGFLLLMTIEGGTVARADSQSSDRFLTYFKEAAMRNPGSGDRKLDGLFFSTQSMKPLVEATVSSSENPEDFLQSLRSLVPLPSKMKEVDSSGENARVRNSGAIRSQGVGIVEILKELKRKNGEEPLVILVPGIFGEFIKDHPFQDVIDSVVSRPSEYSQEFKSKLKATTDVNPNRTDMRFQLSDFDYSLWKAAKEDRRDLIGKKPVLLSEVILVGAIRSAEGEVFANTLTLDTKALSLESLGALRSNSKMFNRRITKFFNIMGRVPKAILLVGYSRGVDIALDMLSLGTERVCTALGNTSLLAFEGGCTEYLSESWLNRVRGFQSVGGVIYGSELADLAFPGLGRVDGDRGQIVSAKIPDYMSRPEFILNSEKVKALAEVAQKLNFIVGVKNNLNPIERVIDSDLNPDIIKKNAEIIHHNTEAWISFLETIMKIQTQTTKNNLSKSWDEFRRNPLNMQKLVQSMSEMQSALATDFKIDVNAAIAQGLGIMKGAFGKLNYNSNILQFKKLVEETLAATSDLTTASRLKWWSQHTIPSNNVKYYSVSATMNADDSLPQNRGSLSSSYNFDTVDFMNLFASYKQFIEIGNFVNNDSQVSLHKSTFNSSLHTRLNVDQLPIKSEPLAVFHTHHWGLTLRSVTPVSPGSQAQKQEPFPRTALLEATLATMATDPDIRLYLE